MRVYRWLAGKTNTVSLATFLLVILLLKVLFLRPIAGMADNGDFFREMNAVGLYDLTDSFEDRHFGYFNRLYGIRQYPYEASTPFASSLHVLIQAAIAVDRLFTGDFIFDIRFLALIYGLFFVVAFYCLCRLMNLSFSISPVIIAGIGLIIFGDTGYLAYFNSFYGEPASYVFLLLTVAMALRVTIKEKVALWDFGVFLLPALLFVTAKQQNVPAAILVVILCLRMMPVLQGKRWRRVIIGAVSLVIVAAGFNILSISEDIRHINQYHAFARGILQGSENPEKDAEELGLDKKFSLLLGTTYYEKYLELPELELMRKEFYSRYGFTAITKYYLMHPQRFMEKLDMAARNGFSIRPEGLGNFEKPDARESGQKSAFFSIWSRWKRIIFPKTMKFILFYYAVNFIVISKYYIHYLKQKDFKGMLKLDILLFIGLTGLMQFGVSFVGAGDADLAKHLFLFNVCFDLMLVHNILFILQRFLGRNKVVQGRGTAHAG